MMDGLRRGGKKTVRDDKAMEVITSGEGGRGIRVALLDPYQLARAPS